MSWSAAPHTADLDFDIQVRIVGMVGDDGGRGDTIKSTLAKNNINIDDISIAVGHRTGFAHVNVDGEGIPKIQTYLGANRFLTPDMIKWSPTPSMVLVQLETPVETVRHVIEQAHELKIPIIFNPAPFDRSHNLRRDSTIFNVDHLILNAKCADQFLGLSWLNETERHDYKTRPDLQLRYLNACNEFHKLGANCVVVTMGSLGAIASYLEPEDRNGCKNPKIYIFGGKQGLDPVCDQTGASDGFIGTYAVEILRQMRSGMASLDIGAAVETGIKAGGLCVSKLGSLDSMPWRDEIYALNNTFVASAPFEDEDEDW